MTDEELDAIDDGNFVLTDGLVLNLVAELRVCRAAYLQSERLLLEEHAEVRRLRSNAETAAAVDDITDRGWHGRP